MRAIIFVFVSSLILAWSIPAAAQTDQAIKACLLLRSPADCYQANAEPYSTPGDQLGVRLLRPAVGEARGDFEATGFGEIGVSTSIERLRQIIVLPLSYQPLPGLSLGVDLPLVRQTLIDETFYGIGDITASLEWNVRGLAGVEGLRSRVIGAVKAPSGSKEHGAGTGALDALGVAQLGWKTGDWLASLSAGFRHNGGEMQDSLAQETLAIAFDAGEIAGVDLRPELRLLSHQVFADATEQALHGALTVRAGVGGFGLGYVSLIVPIVNTTELATGLSLTAGVVVPLSLGG